MSKPVEHEVSAHYDNLRITRDGRNSPTLECSCGEALCTDDTWAGAGQQMDEHLEEVGDR